MMPTADLSLWLPATTAALVSVKLISLVYRLGRTLDRRRLERRKADHYRLLVDLGEARRVVAKIARPPHGLINAGDAGRLLPADGWAVVDQRLPYHLGAVVTKVDRALETFLAHERAEASADDVVFALERLQAYCRGLSNEYSQPAARAAAAAKTRR
jgi:hypothetical protein